MGKRVSILILSLFLECTISLWAYADFNDELNKNESKPVLVKEKTVKLKTEDNRLKGSREKPKLEKKELVKPELKKWWQWPRKEEKDAKKENK